MPTNKTIREEFDEKFVNKHTGYVIGGAEEIKFFIEKALLTQLSEIEEGGTIIKQGELPKGIYGLLIDIDKIKGKLNQ